jgi:putative OPT family oligopeptide transporter
MAIATLIITTFALKATGTTGTAGMIAAISIGTVICIVAAMAGDTSQDLKTGYIVGATPKKQQIGELIGTVVSAISIGGIMYLLSNSWEGFGSEQLSAPQASLMKMVIEGVMGGTLPWVLIFLGVFIAIVVEILGIPILAFAIGLYLPIHLSAPIMVGGAVRWIVEKKFKYSDETERKDCVDKGVLYSAGMIAGEGIIGIFLAVLAVFNIDKVIDLSGVYGNAFQSVGNWVGLIVFALLISSIFRSCRKKKALNYKTK